MIEARQALEPPSTVPTALIIVHLQRGFASDAPEVAALADQVAGYARRRADAYDLTVAARFRPTDAGPYARFVDPHDMQDPEEQQLLPVIESLPGLTVTDGEGYSALTPELLEILRAAGIERVHVAGIDTDQCVLATVFALFDAGLEPVVLKSLTRSTSGQTCHEAGIVALHRAVGEDRVPDQLPGS